MKTNFLAQQLMMTPIDLSNFVLHQSPSESNHWSERISHSPATEHDFPSEYFSVPSTQYSSSSLN